MLRLVVLLSLLAVARPAHAQLFEPSLDVGTLPDGDVFEPLWADPVWPLFSATYNRYANDDNLVDVAAFAIGDVIPFYRWQDPRGLGWLDYTEVGGSAAVFSDFDQNRQSNDQFSAEYVAWAHVAARRGRTSGMLRLMHRSSHVGDEYLTNDSGVEREDFAFERLDLLLSHDLLGDPYDNADGLARVYGGAGRTLQRPTPNDWGYYRLQWGLELRGDRLLIDAFRPIAAVDVTHQEGTDFQPDVSVRLGVQAEHPTVGGRVARFLFEYYNGKEPNGQFYEDDVTILGGGVFISL